MAVKIPRYAKGNNVSLFTVKNPTSIATDGTLTIPADSSANDMHLLGVFDTFEYNGTLKLEEISPADGTIENYAPLKDGFTVTIGEIMKADGTSLLLTEWVAATYFRAACRLTLDGGTPGTSDNIFIVVFIRESIDFAIVEGKEGVKLTGKPCGVIPYYGIMSGATI